MTLDFYKKRIDEISNEITKFDFNNGNHNELILLSQNYIDFLFDFLKIKKEEIASFATIKKYMVYHPQSFLKFVDYHVKIGDLKKSKEEIMNKPSNYYVGFYSIPKNYTCYAFILSPSSFISELSHMGLQLICYSKNMSIDQMVSELFDGTMTINFSNKKGEIRRYVDVYSCLPEEIKSLVRKILSLNEKRLFELISSESELEKLVKKNIENVKECLNRKCQIIPSSKIKPEWMYIFEEILDRHIPASYILTIYRNKFKKDIYFENFWSMIMRTDNLTFNNISNILKNEFYISL